MWVQTASQSQGTKGHCNTPNTRTHTFNINTLPQHTYTRIVTMLGTPAVSPLQRSCPLSDWTVHTTVLPVCPLLGGLSSLGVPYSRQYTPGCSRLSCSRPCHSTRTSSYPPQPPCALHASMDSYHHPPRQTPEHPPTHSYLYGSHMIRPQVM